ncbi:hydroperoxide isomerase ALOXE3-like [Megalops cyprinoides]|uniref:hydroperoxide isomerase ALOXE3-like n=1 Tax=Megalops cyprinoides TaxID=118141 RepID=UPI001864E5EA|nr:hydroperoxide isomerase ALOXE3-like [Megalops cyprinoides]
MVIYKVEVTTGNIMHATTMNNVFIKLVGTEGESDRTMLRNFRGGFYQGSVREFNVSCPTSLGSLVLIHLDKQPLLLFPQDDWFCAKVVVTTPEGETAHFPWYCWLSDREVVAVREGTGKKVYDEVHPLAVHHRKKELQLRKQEYRWKTYLEGIPHCMEADSPQCLPAEVCFSFTKNAEFLMTGACGLAELKLKGLSDCKESWSNLEDIDRVFSNKRTDISEYVQDHWKEDDFFGYQLLNGANPMMIRRCSKLPQNFPVTDDMVQPFLERGSSLATEMQKGNIFLCDYKILEGVPTNVVNGKQQYQAVPLCLLYKNFEDKMLPIAIQLKQQPGKQNPIFLPSDSEHDWLLAKIFVRNAEFSEHQLNSHLLRTHILAEVFTMATLRNLPMVHPLYKLLIPHTRYTLQINSMARLSLIGESGLITQFSATGGEAVEMILKRATSSLTYSSLCLPDDIAARGLESVPNFYYRDDGITLWDIINRFVQGILRYYYHSDAEVQQDSELQSWIGEIFTHGFLEQSSSGIPHHFSTVEEVIKFITMVIFTVSAQHSAVNSGQYDFGGWMPNNPFSLQQPPPTTKGSSDESTILQTLPDVNITVQGMSTSWLLSRRSTDYVALGVYPEERFSEAVPCGLIQKYQAELKDLSESIKMRNKQLKLPYPYLCPEDVENSVAI